MTENEQDFAPNSIFLPLIFKRGTSDGDRIFEHLISTNTDRIINDQFIMQKKELIRIRHPKKSLTVIEQDHLFNLWSFDKDLDKEGCWVFYPWQNRLFHILEKEEFIELRTNRNFYKITPREQKYLAEKTLGIIGLSVGHSVALTIASERICGSLKLADFDILELSNLNRIRTGMQNIGLNKCIITAREIAEIDPFINIECYTDGIDKYNIDEFITENGRLDILIDECDDLLMKIMCRQEAKKHGVPVIMETSDRGMLDVERFDREPDRAILHGMLKDFPMEKLHTLTNEQKVPLVLKIVGVGNASARGKASMMEVGQSIGTWPQLASAVTLGGGVVTDVCRRILLNIFNESGRYYVDLEKIILNKINIEEELINPNPYPVFNWEKAKQIIQSVPSLVNPALIISSDHIDEIIDAGCRAPSTGNDQPWKWIYKNAQIFLFHDQNRSWSFGNFQDIAANISFGGAIENVRLKCIELGFDVQPVLFPNEKYPELIAVLNLSILDSQGLYERDLSLASIINSRCTNRNPSVAVEIPVGDFGKLKKIAEEVEGASLIFFNEKDQLDKLGKIIAECDRVRVFNPSGFKDLVQKEMKWSNTEAENSRDGIDINTLGMSTGQLAALSLIKDKEVMKTLSAINGGDALLEGSKKTVETASAIGFITFPGYEKKSFIQGGIAMERMWLLANELGYAIHPLISPLYLFPRVVHGDGEGLNNSEQQLLVNLRKEFIKLIPILNNTAEVFLFKIAKAENPSINSYRLPLTETFVNLNADVK